MPTDFLTIDKLGDLDEGLAGAAVNRDIASAIRDAEDRGLEDGKPRKVIVELSFEKVSKDQMTVTLESSWKGPKLRTNPTSCRVQLTTKGPSLVFRPDNREHPDQMTFADYAPKRDPAEVDMDSEAN